MYLDEKNHVKWEGVGIYTQKEKLNEWIEAVGIQNLNPDQIIQLKQLRGEKVVLHRDPITGDPKKDFSVKWDDGEVKITFDRPDGVMIKEIYEAMKTLNQDKLNKVFEGIEALGRKHEGFVRVCVRGGVQLGVVYKASYLEYLASDHTQK